MPNARINGLPLPPQPPRCTRRHALQLPLLATTLPAPAGAATNRHPFQFGACVHLSLGRSTAQAVSHHLAQAGLDSLREDIYWSRVERTSGVLAMPAENNALQQAVQLVRDAGGRPLLILSFGNPHHDNGGLVLSDGAIAAFVRYARFVVRHFAGLVDQFEVWNEWNTGFGANPQATHGDPLAYARLLKQVHGAIKQEHPLVQVVGGAVAGLDMAWIDAFFAAGGLDSLDVFSVHSYTLFRFKDHPEGAIHGLDLLRGRMQQARPGREIPVFITEMGWPTHQGRYGVAESTAANYLQRFMLMARSRDWITGVWWYNLVDDGDSDTDMAQRFGLVRRNGTPKPAYLALQRLMPWLRNDSRIQIQRLAAGGYAALSRFNGQARAITWRVSPDAVAWDEGMPAAPPATADLEALAARTPPSGEPVFWDRANGSWARSGPLPT